MHNRAKSPQPVFEQISSGCDIILYGASSSGLRVLHNLLFMRVDPERIKYYDSNQNKHGSELGGRPILTTQEFLSADRNILILISSSTHYEIEPYLAGLGFKNYHFLHGLIYSDKNYEKFDAEFLSILGVVGGLSNMDYDELFTLYSSLEALANLDGAIAEVGVYRGGSAYLLGKLSAGRALYLFDTFEGLPATKHLGASYGPLEGSLSNTSEEAVTATVLESGVPASNLNVRKGVFPSSAGGLENVSFSFVHLDTDLYESTIDGLRFFYPKLQSGGRIVIHDYNCFGCPGVRAAVDEFVGANGLRTSLVEVAESQALILR